MRIRTSSELLLLLAILGSSAADASSPRLRSVRNGRSSDVATWEGGRVPGEGARVQVRSGHIMVYDVVGNSTIRSIHVAGTLRFDPERDTRLDIGLIKIQAGDDPSESGFDCESHDTMVSGQWTSRAALEIGTPDHPVAAGRMAFPSDGGRGPRCGFLLARGVSHLAVGSMTIEEVAFHSGSKASSRWRWRRVDACRGAGSVLSRVATPPRLP